MMTPKKKSIKKSCPNLCTSSVREIRGLIIKGNLVDLLRIEPACILHQNVQKKYCKKYILTVKNAIYSSKCTKSQSIAALLHATRGHSSMLIPQGQCLVQGMENTVCSSIWYQIKDN